MKNQKKEKLSFWLSVLALTIALLSYLIIIVLSHMALLLWFYIAFVYFFASFCVVKAQKTKMLKEKEILDFILFLLITILISLFVLYVFKIAIEKYPYINESVSV
jgi:hypothetical protein